VQRFVIVSGLSGAGKTTALQALEEFGYFTVDNLPPQLWAQTLESCKAQGLEKLAVVSDARTRHFLPGLEEAFLSVQSEVEPEVLFLEADDDMLIRRYGLTRRTHPMQEPTLAADLREERLVLEPLRSKASVVIDTTQLSARALTDKLRGLFGTDNAFTLALFSFGFKHGAPRDADLVLDVRGLPNPFWDEKLRPLSGFDQAVREYVFTPEASAFYHVLKGFIRSSLELAQKAGRTSYTVAIGCTGGRHRSVSVVEALASDLAGVVSVAVEHRDVERGEGGG
jgi:RNase adapter protein RapZ